MNIKSRWWRITVQQGRRVIKSSDPTETISNEHIRRFIESLDRPKPGTEVFSECNNEGRGWEVISCWEYLGNGNWAGKEI